MSFSTDNLKILSYQKPLLYTLIYSFSNTADLLTYASFVYKVI